MICSGNDEFSCLEAYYTFRKRVFVDHEGWILQHSATREFDQFDVSSTAYAMIFRGKDLVAGFRAIRTDQPYLVKDVFPKLATLRQFPSRRDTFEISRFGIAPGAKDRLDLAHLTYGLMFAFARSRGAVCLVALADRTYERYLRAQGIRTRRYGPPQDIGVSTDGKPIEGLVGEIPMNGDNFDRISTLINLTHAMEIKDASCLRRRSALSA
jgi:N-acyl-L-homoserine lactone synthetase